MNSTHRKSRSIFHHTANLPNMLPLCLVLFQMFIFIPVHVIRIQLQIKLTISWARSSFLECKTIICHYDLFPLAFTHVESGRIISWLLTNLSQIRNFFCFVHAKDFCNNKNNNNTVCTPLTTDSILQSRLCIMTPDFTQTHLASQIN